MNAVPAAAQPLVAVSAVRPARPLRFAALGDSLTEGVGDPVPGGWRGWAALLAGDGPGCEFRNFAVSGALTRDVAAEQAPRAREFAPDLASVVVGVNDTLRRSFDIHRIAARLDTVYGDLAEQGAVLLTACLPDPGAMLALPGPLARPLARRQRAVNAVVHALSARYGAAHLHLAERAWVADRTLWSADRLHPGERGHRLIAVRCHTLLAERGVAPGGPPSAEPDRPPPGTSASLLWLATAGTAWLARRSTDLLPELLGLAGAELRHAARGTGAHLDLRAAEALSAALAAVACAPHDRAPEPPGAARLARMGG
ncbi:SGNH/GDSL hydrolase family protein [Streptomyces sp. NPDC048696]|uniref:SGNH/GDSL hydrolase family protein n=1 Tax=Streptomyces sp. NPDC048696 TaxID=3365585 RepID=UPI00371092EB